MSILKKRRKASKRSTWKAQNLSEEEKEKKAKKGSTHI